jgi:hypothetical protein
MTSREIDPINPAHKGLCLGEEELILAEANYQRFTDLMPSIKITVHGDITIEHAAVLGQLWLDLTYFYARMVNVDPTSNPEVGNGKVGQPGGIGYGNSRSNHCRSRVFQVHQCNERPAR